MGDTGGCPQHLINTGVGRYYTGATGQAQGASGAANRFGNPTISGAGAAGYAGGAGDIYLQTTSGNISGTAGGADDGVSETGGTVVTTTYSDGDSRIFGTSGWSGFY